jgi:hypothetical protein
MRGFNRFISAFILAGAILVPTAIVAAALPQEASVQVRVYDRDHKDYHNWDDREDRAYRSYLNDQHRSYRAYDKQSHKDQRNYWNYRHNHPDHD